MLPFFCPSSDFVKMSTPSFASGFPIHCSSMESNPVKILPDMEDVRKPSTVKEAIGREFEAQTLDFAHYPYEVCIQYRPSY